MHDLMNCVWLLDEVQLQQCTRNQVFLRYSMGDTVLGGVYSTRDRVENGKFTDAHISRTKGGAAF